MIGRTMRIEINVKFLYPGIILKGDVYSDTGEKIADGGQPLTMEIIEDLRARNIRSVYYSRPRPDEKTTGEKKMLDIGHVESAINIAQEVENAIRSKTPIPTKEINTVVGDLVDNIRLEDGAILNLLELKDFDDYTYTHSINVALIAILFAKRMNYPEHLVHWAGVAGLLHDEGKIMIPVGVIQKPGRLDESEMQMIRRHPIYSYEIVRATRTFPAPVQAAILYHHEKFCGSGYPLGIKGERMGEIAQMISLSDIFDAITSERSYQRARPFWFALTEIYREIEKSFSPRIAKIFLGEIPYYITQEEIFRTGSIVELNTGEVAEVTGHQFPQTVSPVVHVYLNSRKEPMRYPIEVDLEYDDSRYISDVIDEGVTRDMLLELKTKFGR